MSLLSPDGRLQTCPSSWFYWGEEAQTFRPASARSEARGFIRISTLRQTETGLIKTTVTRVSTIPVTARLIRWRVLGRFASLVRVEQNRADKPFFGSVVRCVP
jgi:hypothetical protein